MAYIDSTRDARSLMEFLGIQNIRRVTGFTVYASFDGEPLKVSINMLPDPDEGAFEPIAKPIPPLKLQLIEGEWKHVDGTQ